MHHPLPRAGRGRDGAIDVPGNVVVISEAPGDLNADGIVDAAISAC